MKRILVTGSDGYIGAVLTDYLRRQGYDVTGLDTLYFDDVVLGRYQRPYPLIRRDIRSVSELDVRGYDAIVHLAALSNDATGQLHPAVTEDINLRATIALARLAKRQRVKRFLFSSSCSMYGIRDDTPAEEGSPLCPLTAYARSKAMAEEALRSLADKRFCIGILRNATIYGYSPKFRSDLVVNNLVASALALQRIEIHSDGTPWRPLMDIRDLCDAFIALLYADAGAVNGVSINVGFDENNYQIKQVVEEVRTALPGSRVVYTHRHGADTRSYRVSFQKFKTLFPRITQRWPLKRSIRDMIRNLRMYHFIKKDFVNGRFDRVRELKKLMVQKKLNDTLYWM